MHTLVDWQDVLLLPHTVAAVARLPRHELGNFK